ncbi:MAG TPA: hypothetical protein VGQ96_04295, partial [Candidatus Eremiobacteraceae bacterium]|nr:hypothetical protein [Candidatus Eremiobacteraceae bacterium]
MRTLTALTLSFVCASVIAAAAVQTASAAPKATPAPTAAPAASAGERQFVYSVSKDLQSRFGTTAQAAAAGYFRYTDEDQTGAISWVNTKYWQSDPKQPSQLWYDVNGRLIGADFSVLQSGSKAKPKVWGISPSRWLDFSPAHVHFGLKSGSGIEYGGVGPKSMKMVGGSLANPTADDIVKLGKTQRWKVLKIPAPRSAHDVAFVFPFPALWDLQVWLVPNPLGAFAEHNP